MEVANILMANWEMANYAMAVQVMVNKVMVSYGMTFLLKSLSAIWHPDILSLRRRPIGGRRTE